LTFGFIKTVEIIYYYPDITTLTKSLSSLANATLY